MPVLKNSRAACFSSIALSFSCGLAGSAALAAEPEVYSPVPMAVPSVSGHSSSTSSSSSSSSPPSPVVTPAPAPVPVILNGATPRDRDADNPVPVAPSASKGGRIFPSPVGALKTGTDSTTLQTGTNSTTLQTGTGSTTLQVGTQSTTLQAGTGSSLLRTGVERQAEPVNILFIVDGSRSMLEALDHGTQKIDAAKTVLQNALATIPPDINLGLRVFGQGYAGAGGGGNLFAGAFGGVNIVAECQNSALWVPIGKNNRRAIIEKVRGLHPYGMTPLAYAIWQAAISDFRNTQGTKTIILITDGADTCNGDPCKVIRELLPKYGIKIKVDVVGLSLHREPQARNQLNCVAESSGGKYADAKTAAELIDSVTASVSKAIEGRVIIHPSAPVNPLNPATPQDNQNPIEKVPLQDFLK